MLFPKRVKYRKSQRGRRKGLAVSGSTVCFGEFGIKTLEPAWIKSSQIETVRIILSRRLRRGGKLWIRIFPDKPITKKPAETRMGKGKGDVDTWVAVVKRGTVLFEMGGIPQDYARASFRLIAYKFPFKTVFVTRKK
jgi:large subunit ribosomal protein L16